MRETRSGRRRVGWWWHNRRVRGEVRRISSCFRRRKGRREGEEEKEVEVEEEEQEK